MRALSLIPLAFAVVVAGCGSEPQDAGRGLGVPKRDLTLQQAPAPDMAVASRLEVPRPRPERPTVHSPRHSPEPALAPSRKPGPPDASSNAEAGAGPPPAPAPASGGGPPPAGAAARPPPPA